MKKRMNYIEFDTGFLVNRVMQINSSVEYSTVAPDGVCK